MHPFSIEYLSSPHVTSKQEQPITIENDLRKTTSQSSCHGWSDSPKKTETGATEGDLPEAVERQVCNGMGGIVHSKWPPLVKNTDYHRQKSSLIVCNELLALEPKTIGLPKKGRLFPLACSGMDSNQKSSMVVSKESLALEINHPVRVSCSSTKDLGRKSSLLVCNELLALEREVTAQRRIYSKMADVATGKPPHSYTALIAMAILNSPEQTLLLREIYQYCLDKFPYYKTQNNSWKNCVRYNLSIHNCFIKAGRGRDGRRSGNLWAIHPECIEDFLRGDYSNKCMRKRESRRNNQRVIQEKDVNAEKDAHKQPRYHPYHSQQQERSQKQYEPMTQYEIATTPGAPQLLTATSNSLLPLGNQPSHSDPDKMMTPQSVAEEEHTPPVSPTLSDQGQVVTSSPEITASQATPNLSQGRLISDLPTVSPCDEHAETSSIVEGRISTHFGVLPHDYHTTSYPCESASLDGDYYGRNAYPTYSFHSNWPPNHWHPQVVKPEPRQYHLPGSSTESIGYMSDYPWNTSPFDMTYPKQADTFITATKNFGKPIPTVSVGRQPLFKVESSANADGQFRQSELLPSDDRVPNWSLHGLNQSQHWQNGVQKSVINSGSFQSVSNYVQRNSYTCVTNRVKPFKATENETPPSPIHNTDDGPRSHSVQQEVVITESVQCPETGQSVRSRRDAHSSPTNIPESHSEYQHKQNSCHSLSSLQSESEQRHKYAIGIHAISDFESLPRERNDDVHRLSLAQHVASTSRVSSHSQVSESHMLYVGVQGDNSVPTGMLPPLSEMFPSKKSN